MNHANMKDGVKVKSGNETIPFGEQGEVNDHSLFAVAKYADSVPSYRDRPPTLNFDWDEALDNYNYSFYEDLDPSPLWRE